MQQNERSGLDVQFFVGQADPRWCYPMILVVGDDFNDSCWTLQWHCKITTTQRKRQNPPRQDVSNVDLNQTDLDATSLVC